MCNMTCSSLLQHRERTLVHLLVKHDGAAIARLFLLQVRLAVERRGRHVETDAQKLLCGHGGEPARLARHIPARGVAGAVPQPVVLGLDDLRPCGEVAPVGVPKRRSQRASGATEASEVVAKLTTVPPLAVGEAGVV